IIISFEVPVDRLLTRAVLCALYVLSALCGSKNRSSFSHARVHDLVNPPERVIGHVERSVRSLPKPGRPMIAAAAADTVESEAVGEDLIGAGCLLAVERLE